MKILYSMFAVDDVPYCVWDWDLKSLNLGFLNSIDPMYFEYSVQAHADNLQGDDKHRAAMALRSTYFHALETLFALICAALQAPECVVGWLQKYQTSQLRNMISSINDGRASFFTKLNIEPLTWQSIAHHINHFSYPDQNRTIETKKLFGILWQRLAAEFVDEYSVLEYNSIKHGFRAAPGGFAIEVGSEDQYGVPPPPERMQLLGSNEFGISFFRAEQILDSRGDPNLRITRSSVGWNPEATAYALLLLRHSINNIVSFLKILNGVDPATAHFTRPVDADIFDKPWSEPPSIQNYSLNFEIDEKSIRKFTREELEAELQRRFSKSASDAS